MYRKIIHLDLDAFFCAVEELHNPQLVGKPFVVGGRPDQRGVVASCSYAARKFGVHSAMPMSRAVRVCPKLIIVPARHKAYSQVSKQVMEYLHQVTELVEQVSIDEAFLDVTDLKEPVDSLAYQLQSTIQTELKLPNSLGVASNKLVAKIATDYGKSKSKVDGPPNAIQIVPPGQEAAFLASLPVVSLLGVGPKTSDRLSKMGIHTIGDLAQWNEVDLVKMFGKHGQHLYLQAKGIDNRPVVTSHPIKSISQETTFPKDVHDIDSLCDTLKSLSSMVSTRLKKHRLAGHTVRLKLRLSDFTTLTRQITLQHPTDQEDIIFRIVSKLLLTAWNQNQSVRLLGVGVSNFKKPLSQLSLWQSETEDDASNKHKRLNSVVKELRIRFGDQILHWGDTDQSE
jgi:DNA polymerase IV